MIINRETQQNKIVSLKKITKIKQPMALIMKEKKDSMQIANIRKEKKGTSL